MSPKEVVSTLQEKAKTDHAFTEIVWQRLNVENHEFFQAYYTRLALKQQLEQFNALLDKQRQLMNSKEAKVSSQPTSNGFHHHAVLSLPNYDGSHIPALMENPTWYYADVQTPESVNQENIRHGMNSKLSNVSNNVGSSFGMVDMSVHGDISSSSPHIFGADGNVFEASPNFSVASFTINNVEPNSNFVNEALSRNFSFPDVSVLASMFLGKNSSSCLTGVLDDYPGSPS